MKGMSILSKERLTEKTKDCFGYRLKDGPDAEVGFFKDYDAFYSHMMTVKALGEYEDLEEQGLLLRLPIAIGTKVYSVLEEQVPKHHYEICECEIEDVSSKAFYCDYEWWEFGSDNFYFSRAEAEEKLRELNEESEE